MNLIRIQRLLTKHLAVLETSRTTTKKHRHSVKMVAKYRAILNRSPPVSADAPDFTNFDARFNEEFTSDAGHIRAFTDTDYPDQKMRVVVGRVQSGKTRFMTWSALKAFQRSPCGLIMVTMNINRVRLDAMKKMGAITKEFNIGCIDDITAWVNGGWRNNILVVNSNHTVLDRLYHGIGNALPEGMDEVHMMVDEADLLYPVNDVLEDYTVEGVDAFNAEHDYSLTAKDYLMSMTCHVPNMNVVLITATPKRIIKGYLGESTLRERDYIHLDNYIESPGYVGVENLTFHNVYGYETLSARYSGHIISEPIRRFLSRPDNGIFLWRDKTTLRHHLYWSKCVPKLGPVKQYARNNPVAVVYEQAGLIGVWCSLGTREMFPEATEEDNYGFTCIKTDNITHILDVLEAAGCRKIILKSGLMAGRAISYVSTSGLTYITDQYMNVSWKRATGDLTQRLRVLGKVGDGVVRNIYLPEHLYNTLMKEYRLYEDLKLVLDRNSTNPLQPTLERIEALPDDDRTDVPSTLTDPTRELSVEARVRLFNELPDVPFDDLLRYLEMIEGVDNAIEFMRTRGIRARMRRLATQLIPIWWHPDCKGGYFHKKRMMEELHTRGADGEVDGGMGGSGDGEVVPLDAEVSVHSVCE